MKYPKLEDLNCNTCTEKSIKLHYPEFWKYLIETYPNELIWSERLYWFYHDLKDFPKCPVCGNKVNFTNFRIGYKIYCSRKCLNSDPVKKEKTRKTCLEKYGGVAPAASKEVVLKMQNTSIKKYGVYNIQKLNSTKEKTRKTCLEKYGGQGNESESIKEKYIESCLNNYGVNNPMLNKECCEKLKQTCIKKYGYSSASKSNSIKNKIKNSRREYEIHRQDFLIGYTENGDWICKCPHPDCNKCFEKYYIVHPLIFNWRKHDNTEPCTNLLPIGKDNTKNTTIELFIQNILVKNNISYTINDRSIISPKELDIYIPSKNIAIECNGIYSHSIKYKSPSYHIQKYKDCHAQNIQLLSIWEDWVKTKPQIVESIILNKLGVCNNTIYARKTHIKEIDSKICNEFLDNNHIQGRSAASIHLGLYMGEDLVSVMTFSRPRVNMGGKEHKQEWELVRFCNKLNIRVVGGASKLLKYFIKQYNPKSIVSFSMNDISNGDLYKTLGFESDDKITQSYWYIDPKTMKRYHRTSFTKQSIVKRGWRDVMNSSWTEKQVMAEQGYFCIYDSGQLKWILNLEN